MKWLPDVGHPDFHSSPGLWPDPPPPGPAPCPPLQEFMKWLPDIGHPDYHSSPLNKTKVHTYA